MRRKVHEFGRIYKQNVLLVESYSKVRLHKIQIFVAMGQLVTPLEIGFVRVSAQSNAEDVTGVDKLVKIQSVYT